VFVKLWDEPCQQKSRLYRHVVVAIEPDAAGGSNDQMQIDFVKLGTSTTKKVAKYSGERRMNDYISTVGKSM